jgi:Phosphoenolpyruvate-dependent sugar phosphotransferase system, EIIA 2
MKVSDFLSPANVITDVAFADKQKLLEELARRAAMVVDVPPTLMLSELLKRERLGSTGMGGGVAIPHVRFHQVGKPFGMLVRLKRPIDFDAVDDARSARVRGDSNCVPSTQSLSNRSLASDPPRQFCDQMSLSDSIIQKGLAFRRHWSGTVR